LVIRLNKVDFPTLGRPTRATIEYAGISSFLEHETGSQLRPYTAQALRFHDSLQLADVVSHAGFITPMNGISALSDYQNAFNGFGAKM
jgi:hypothetical protein